MVELFAVCAGRPWKVAMYVRRRQSPCPSPGGDVARQADDEVEAVGAVEALEVEEDENGVVSRCGSRRVEGRVSVCRAEQTVGRSAEVGVVGLVEHGVDHIADARGRRKR